MRQRVPDSWEARLDRACKALPPRHAPDTLLPRVMAVVQARASLPWWQQAWPAWPRWVQCAFLVLGFAAASALTWYLPAVWPDGLGASLWSEAVSLAKGTLSAFRFAASMGNALEVALGQTARYLALGAAALCLGMYFSCLAVGTACYRLATK